MAGTEPVLGPRASADPWDPEIGRFLSADPIVQDLTDSQSLNRYSYVRNNPLSLVDPSGFSWLSSLFTALVRPFGTLGFIFRKAVDSFFRNNQWAQALLMAASAFCGPAAAGCAAGTASYISGINGGSVGQMLIAGAIAYATATAMQYVGDVTNGHLNPNGSGGFGRMGPNGFEQAYASAGEYMGSMDFVGNVAGHALVGCASGAASGGKCGPSALAGGISAAAGPKLATQGFYKGLVGSMAVGGAASVAGGGKFWNGAQTAAYGYLFNSCAAVQGGCWTALKDAASMTYDWATGGGAERRVFGPGSIQVEDMRDAPGVNAAREYFYNKNAGNISSGSSSPESVTNYKAKFGLVSLVTTASPTQQFVGSYRVDIYPFVNGNGMLFIVNNTSSFRSLGYGVVPDWGRNQFGPGGNMSQTYIWTEPIKP